MPEDWRPRRGNADKFPVYNAPLTPREASGRAAAELERMQAKEKLDRIAWMLSPPSPPAVAAIPAPSRGGDATEVGNHAHRLKGTVAYLGAGPALDAITRVEQIGRSGDLRKAARAIDELAERLTTLKAALTPHYQSDGPL